MIYNNIDDFLSDSQNELVIFCVGNAGLSSMITNLVQSGKNNNIHITVFALDDTIAKNLEGITTVVKYKYNCTEGYNNYATKEFKLIAWRRYFIANVLLNNGKTFIYLDADCVINNHFVNDILKYLQETNCDCCIQFDSPNNYCTGFFAMKSTPRTVDVFNSDFFIKNNYLDYLDQEFFNEIIIKKYDLINIKVLDRDLFPNGNHYYKYYQSIDQNCKVIHFNCIVGLTKKINMMKKFKKWVI